MDDFNDWIAYNIFIGNGSEFGFDDDEEEEEPDLSEQVNRILEPLQNLTEEWERIDRDGTRHE